MARSKKQANVGCSKFNPIAHADFWVGLVGPFNRVVDKERFKSSDWDPAQDLKDEVKAAQVKAIFAELCGMAQGLQDDDADYYDISTAMDRINGHVRLDQLGK